MTIVYLLCRLCSSDCFLVKCADQASHSWLNVQGYQKPPPTLKTHIEAFINITSQKEVTNKTMTCLVLTSEKIILFKAQQFQIFNRCVGRHLVE